MRAAEGVPFLEFTRQTDAEVAQASPSAAASVWLCIHSGDSWEQSFYFSPSLITCSRDQREQKTSLFAARTLWADSHHCRSKETLKTKGEKRVQTSAKIQRRPECAGRCQRLRRFQPEGGRPGTDGTVL